MEKHTFLWQYKKETPDEGGVSKVEACSGTVEMEEIGNEMKIEDSRSKIIKTEDSGKSTCCTVEMGENGNEMKIEDSSKIIKTEDRGKSTCCMRHRIHITTEKLYVYHHACYTCNFIHASWFNPIDCLHVIVSVV
jgi:hypothetical protein